MEYLPSYRNDLYYGNELYHYGVKGMRWGVRRYQNPDGTRIKKASIGSIKRVRQKQDMFRSKINSDGILGKGDTGPIRRNLINDWRRGRIRQLEAKAKNREAIRNFKIDKTKANAKKVAITAAKRVGLNNINPTMIGRYNRYRNDDNNSVGLALGRTALTLNRGGKVGAIVGEKIVDTVRPNSDKGTGGAYRGNAKYIKRRKAYAKRTGQKSKI